MTGPLALRRLVWTYKERGPFEEPRPLICEFCMTQTIVGLPEELLAEQPDDTTHVCLNCGHGFAVTPPEAAKSALST